MRKKTKRETATPRLRKETFLTLTTLSEENLAGVVGGKARTQCNDPTFVSGGYCCT